MMCSGCDHTTYYSAGGEESFVPSWAVRACVRGDRAGIAPSIRVVRLVIDEYYRPILIAKLNISRCHYGSLCS